MATAFPIDGIEYKDLAFHEKIGEGAFGSVHRLTFLRPFKGYNQVAGKSVFKMDEKEVQLMSQLHHRHIVKLVGLSQSGPIHVILMEYAPNGSLRDYLSDASQPLPIELRIKWIEESALAIQYLHDQNFLHRDIKSSNCLLFEDNLLKLCDFGIARKIEHSESTSSQKGTYRYMSPELHVGNDQGRAVFSKPADIYAYGMLMLEICIRKPPFQTWEWPKLVLEVGRGAKPTIPSDCSKDLAGIMQQCWEYNPKQRPTIASIISDVRMATAFPVDNIEYKDLTFHEQIGEGAFGKVHRVTFLRPHEGYNEIAGKTVFKMDEKEVQLMSRLHHRHIVKLVGLCQSGPIHVILMEYAPNRSLHDYLSDSSKPLPSGLRIKWIKESALAIQYLHDQNFLHRDIKSSNCLLFEDNLLKLCDFGLTRRIDCSQTSSSQKDTYRYMAPEIHGGNDRGRDVFSKPADIYAYGMLMLEICTRKPPFHTWEWHKVVYEVGSGAKPTVPTDCSKDLAGIMQQCWEYNPKQRPTIASIIADLDREGEKGTSEKSSTVLTEDTTRRPRGDEVDGVDDKLSVDEFMTPKKSEHLFENDIFEE
ncbi:tyrosine-protein kinase JAK1-like [Amphiura filiformis]|uniref:tyrosine-protein kinase JAK1-like n=1 Tax=Amphiura filiformis TaxID=82378 RepID=UPI003B22198A